jgi:hypothetical protein
MGGCVRLARPLLEIRFRMPWDPAIGQQGLEFVRCRRFHTGQDVDQISLRVDQAGRSYVRRSLGNVMMPLPS